MSTIGEEYSDGKCLRALTRLFGVTFGFAAGAIPVTIVFYISYQLSILSGPRPIGV